MLQFKLIISLIFIIWIWYFTLLQGFLELSILIDQSQHLLVPTSIIK